MCMIKCIPQKFLLFLLGFIMLPFYINATQAKHDRFFYAGWAVGIVMPMYKDPVIKKQQNILYEKEKFITLPLSLELNGNFIISKNIHITGGFIFTADLRFASKIYTNRLDYTFFSGVRIYPNLKGFHFGLDYALGSRADFIKLDKNKKHSIATTPWGNGFRFTVGYDFRYINKKWMPNLQFKWRYMPRGNTHYDNYIGFSVQFAI